MRQSVRLLLLAACMGAGRAAIAEHKPADPAQYVSTQLTVSGADQGQIALVSLKDTNFGPRHVKGLRDLEVRKVAN
ncbi:hypothetical protein ACFQ09_25245 [Massilia norwichensis]|uniref:Uncharacterized protein n=1 Tax=Massilia norwichensis TaxID=1442366 RepID=A0ABT2ABV9_9BURK|nr:hypothetical protein [Massilia norwichensis]MCS0591637.1 hypothetical protein [Massilia norwichensis]